MGNVVVSCQLGFNDGTVVVVSHVGVQVKVPFGSFELGGTVEAWASSFNACFHIELLFSLLGLGFMVVQDGLQVGLTVVSLQLGINVG